jgi:hypothetical protein
MSGVAKLVQGGDRWRYVLAFYRGTRYKDWSLVGPSIPLTRWRQR